VKCFSIAENLQNNFHIVLPYNYMGLLRAIIVRTEQLLIPVSVMSTVARVASLHMQLRFKAAIRADPIMNRFS